MVVRFNVIRVPEPQVEFFGPTPHADPKVGLRDSGPFSLRYGDNAPGAVRLGIVGPRIMIDATRRWFERCQSRILSTKTNRERFPDFPGFENVFRVPLVLSDRFDHELTPMDLRAALQFPEEARFREVIELYANGVETLARRQQGPNVVVCALSEEVLQSCSTLEAMNRAGPRPEKGPMGETQLTLPIGDEDQSDTEEHLLFRTFRRVLKARVMRMKNRLPTQIVQNKLLVDGPGKDDAATRAWSVCVGLFYKAGGIPWRLAHIPPQTLFVGLSFHHLRTTRQDAMYVSTAQAYSTDIEGFVLRLNERLPQREDRQVFLSGTQAERLGQAILNQYRTFAERPPVRIVFHKTTRFRPEELEGFASSLRDAAIVEYISLAADGPSLQLFNEGQYPPPRGTLCTVNDDARFLYTTGFYQAWGTYPGPHIPRPLEITLAAGVDNPRRACEEILGLTKMNWNAASPGGSLPMTLQMARAVGPIMAEVPDYDDPDLSYRYYM